MTIPDLDWLDPARAAAFARWLAALAPQHALQIDSVRLASADASFRRYFRIDSANGAGSCIIIYKVYALRLAHLSLFSGAGLL